jgi:hypothetical protein
MTMIAHVENKYKPETTSSETAQSLLRNETHSYAYQETYSYLKH